LTICVKMRSIGKSWTRDYLGHVISCSRLHDMNGTQHMIMMTLSGLHDHLSDWHVH